MAEILPIVFSPTYDISVPDMEHYHPFDSAKYGKVFQYLIEQGILDGHNHHVPGPLPGGALLKVHTLRYLNSLREASSIAQIAELPFLYDVPVEFLDQHLLAPIRQATQGTVEGLQLAWERGWAINLAGGYHHAKGDFAHGFCFYADIPLAAYTLLEQVPDLKIMVLDLDAHQGNGFEAVLADDPRFVMVDVYNQQIFPRDSEAAQFIHYPFPIKSGTKTRRYLKLIRKELPRILDQERPDLLIYNAGSDIYEHDPLGELAVSAEGIQERDRFVFQAAFKDRGIPTLMLLSGGYVKDSYQIIGASVSRLIRELGLVEALGNPPH